MQLSDKPSKSSPPPFMRKSSPAPSMRSMRPRERISSASGYTQLITLSFLLPLFLILTWVAVRMFMLMRAAIIVFSAAHEGANVAKMRTISPSVLMTPATSSTYQSNYITTTPTNPINLKSLELTFDKCQGVAPNRTFETCYHDPNGLWKSAMAGPSPAPPTTALISWKGFTANIPLGMSVRTANVYELPFPLYEPYSHVEPSYNKVQYLPIVCIRRGCLEPFNETGASASSLPSITSAPDYCTSVRPVCWSNDERLDFDGDGEEDIVIFRPNGRKDFGASYTGDDDRKANVDWIVYPTASAYSLQTGGMFFNLGMQVNPGQTEDIPIPADYDRDGLTDFAVYSPTLGRISIAFSSYQYQKIGRARAPLDSDFSSGFIPIPGVYDPNGATPGSLVPYQDRRMSIAFIPVNGGGPSTGGARYEPVFLEIPALPEVAPTSTIFAISSPLRNITDFQLKPHAGTTSVPAFADYDRDGITEMGYLSWNGGNLTKRVAGRLDAGTEFTDPQSTESDKEIRVNPFDIVSGNRGELYSVDSVAGVIWRIDPENGNTSYVDGNDGEIVKAVVNASTSNTDISYFPKYNVLNVPKWPDLVSPSRGVTPASGSYVLNSPRKIAIAPEGSMFVSNWGAGELLKFSQVTPIDISSQTTRIAYCDSSSDSCDTLANLTSSPSRSVPQDKFNQILFNPIAVAIIPDPSRARVFHVAFSDGNSVYLLINDEQNKAPDGYLASGGSETIIRIAGVADQKYGTCIGVSTKNYPPDQNNFSLDRTALQAGYVSANNRHFCPVVDLAFDFKSFPSEFNLYASSSCNVGKRPVELRDGEPNSITLYPVAGGILKFNSIDSTSLNNWQVTLAAGGFWTECEIAAETPAAVPPNFSATPSTSSLQTIPQTIQRKVNITPSSVFARPDGISTTVLKNNDIYNPVAIEFDEAGNLLFINQWNQKAWNYSDTKRFDNHFVHGIYRLNFHTQDIEAITNPLSYGSYTIPIESGKWWAPGMDKFPDSDPNRIAPWDNVPVKNVHFPAVSGLAFSTDKSRLYASAPYMVADAWYTAPGSGSEPQDVKSNSVGFIHRILMDTDGDGQADFKKGSWSSTGGYLDADLDGDGVDNNEEESMSNRSSYCPEIVAANDNTSCRVQERVGMPIWYFFRKGGEGISIPYFRNPYQAIFTDTTNLKLIEFPLLNSVGKFVSNIGSRPDNWATVLNAPTDVLDGTSPIAAPLPLHGFVGSAPCTLVCSGGFFSYPDIETGSGGPTSGAERQFLFPVVLGGTAPFENQIKSVKRLSKNTTSAPGSIEKSGSLCFDNIAGARSPFYSTWQDNFLGFFAYTAIPSFDQSDVNLYGSRCGVTLGWDLLPPSISISSHDTRRYANEPLVLQLDQDDSGVDETPSSNGTNKPPAWVKGRLSTETSSENLRLFNMIDHDGDGIRNPTWFGREVFLSNKTSSALGFPYAIYDSTQNAAMLVASGGLVKNKISNFELSRYPVTDKGAFGFPLNDSNDPSYFSYPRAFRFLNESPTEPQYNNTLFDPGWSGTPLTPGRDDGFVFSLDLESTIPNHVRNVTSVNSLPSQITAKLASSTRFHGADLDAFGFAEANCATEDGASPGLVSVAALGMIVKALHIESCYFYKPPNLDQMKNAAYVTLLNDQVITNNCSSRTTKPCNGIEVGYTYEFLGAIRIFKYQVHFGENWLFN